MGLSLRSVANDSGIVVDTLFKCRVAAVIVQSRFAAARSIPGVSPKVNMKAHDRKSLSGRESVVS